MKKSVKFSPEVCKRAVCMVTKCHADLPSLWSAVKSIAAKIGCTSLTLLTWVRQHERDSGQHEGPSTADHKRVKELEPKVKELSKANKILKLASTFFAQAELDRRFKP
jgi:transposase